MTLPRAIAAAVEEKGVQVKGTVFSIDGRVCEGARFHSPTPLLLREVRVGKRKVLLCGACADNFALLKLLIAAHEGDPPWELRREFGNQMRALLGKTNG